MDMVNGKMGSEQLQAQARIWNHIFNSMCLKCAIQLGILETIHHHGQPMNTDALISALQIHPSRAHGVERLMRILIHSRFSNKRSSHRTVETPMYSTACPSSSLRTIP
ncbi:hypothetical protein NL676_017417 [Syzygium grande]|nr:hypothetical protein NL676_017417 [Syzygium grande]